MGLGGPWLVALWIHEALPGGNYPFWFFGVPVWIGCLLFFASASAVLGRLGIAVFRPMDEGRHEGADRAP
jgi:hypothetical protein